MTRRGKPGKTRRAATSGDDAAATAERDDVAVAASDHAGAYIGRDYVHGGKGFEMQARAFWSLQK